MNSAAKVAFNYKAVSREDANFLIGAEVEIGNRARRAAEDIVRIGQLLTEAKQRLGHGKFLEWINRCFVWSEDSAERFIGVSKHFNLRTVRNLTIDVSSLYLIAAPSTPAPVRKELVRRASSGEQVTKGGTLAVMESYRETGSLPPAAAALTGLVEEKRRIAQQMKDRYPSPVEAKQIAIQTGAHTLDSSGRYQKPLTAEAEAVRAAQMDRVRGAESFMTWWRNNAVTAQDVIETLHANPAWIPVCLGTNNEIAAVAAWWRDLERGLVK